MIHYEIKSDDRLIYSSFRVNQDLAATNIKYVDEVGKVPTLTFDLPPDNPVTLEVIKSEVQLYRNGEMIFNGNVKTRKRKFNKFVTYYCEGDLGYLHDIFVRPIEPGTTTEGGFIGDILGLYQTAAINRQLSVGNLAPGQTITYNIEDYTDCYDAITDNLISIYRGGFLRTKHELRADAPDGVPYWHHCVDFFTSPPSDPNAQKIVYAKNILDINDDDDGRDIVTHYIPLGATVDKDRVKLSGNDYIAADSATLTEYGVIERVQDYSDVEDSSTLSTYANQDYAAMELARKKRAVKIKAVDMAIVDGDETPLQVGYLYEVYSHPHGIEFVNNGTDDDNRKQLLRAEIDPNNPDKCVFWFGDVPRDSMRRIQADRALAEETRQRVQKEASYTNAVGVTPSGETYVSQAATDKTGGGDVTTASGVYNVSVSWTSVDIDVELAESDFSIVNGSLGVSGTLSVSGSPTVGGESKSISGSLWTSGTLSVNNGTLKAKATALKLKKVLYKGTTSTIPFHRSLGNATAIVSVIDSSGKIIGGTSAVTGTNPTMTLYAVGNNPPPSVNVAVIAIGTE